MTARLQVLYLPAAGETATRYALVVDQAADLPVPDREALRAFAVEAGAQGCVVLSSTVDLAHDDSDDDETAEALGELLRGAFAPQAGHQPAKPKLPPANTTEGKLARVWGGKPTAEGDPQS